MQVHIKLLPQKAEKVLLNLCEKFENEKEIRKEEMGMKKKGQENKAAQHQMLMDQQRQNQQQYQDALKIMNDQ